MVETSLNIFDLVVLVVVGLSALLSFYRGFLREVMSLGSWIGASVITLYAFPTASEWIKPQVKSDMVATGFATLGVFMVTLILISIISGMFLKYLKPSGEIGFMDNMVGLVFGVARGVLILAIAYLVMDRLMTEKNFPDWVKEAKTREYVAEAAELVAKIAPSYLASMEETTEGIKNEGKKAADKSSSIKLPNMDAAEKNRIGLPSMEELQQRIREENEKSNVR